jgi:hypothetical protein
MNLAKLSVLLARLGDSLPAFLIFVNSIAAAWQQLMLATGGRLMAESITADEVQECVPVLRLAGDRFGLERVAKLVRFIMQHPQILEWVLPAFKFKLVKLAGGDMDLEPIDVSPAGTPPLS